MHAGGAAARRRRFPMPAVVTSPCPAVAASPRPAVIASPCPASSPRRLPVPPPSDRAARAAARNVPVGSAPPHPDSSAAPSCPVPHHAPVVRRSGSDTAMWSVSSRSSRIILRASARSLPMLTAPNFP